MGSQLTQQVTEYLERIQPSAAQVLLEMEQFAKERKFPIIGSLCGRVLATLTLAVGGKRIFEMGSGFGYSTVWFASAVGESGLVVHTDGDALNTAAAMVNLEKAGFKDRCRFETGDALEILAAEPEPFDGILIDVDKTQYPLALKVAVPKLRVGGLLLCHNVLWSGRVAEDSHEPETVAIRQFNSEIMGHPELLSYIDPVDDGLSVSLKVLPEQRSAIPV